MALQIVWTDLAEVQLDNILRYWVKRNNSTAYAIKLNELIQQTVRILSIYPDSRRITNNKNLRLKSVKDYFVYYSYNKELLNIVAICDMRRDPKHIKKLLE